MKKKFTYLTLMHLSFLNGVWSTSCQAATATANFQVTATVQAACTITATNLAFGNYDGTVNVDATNTITVNCTNGAPWTITLSGAGAGGARTMTNGTANLNYNIFRDTLRAEIWGTNAPPTTHAVTGTGNGANQANTGYGRVPIGQTAGLTVGTYTATITATVTY